MSGTVVDRTEWETALDRLTEQHDGDYVTIEVVDPSLGEQLEVERLPFRYAAYDRRADTVVIAVGGTTARYPVVLRHLIANPVTVTIDPAAEPSTLVIGDKEDTSTLITFYKPE
jgi:hypothetical protein